MSLKHSTALDLLYEKMIPMKVSIKPVPPRLGHGYRDTLRRQGSKNRPS